MHSKGLTENTEKQQHAFKQVEVMDNKNCSEV